MKIQSVADFESMIAEVTAVEVNSFGHSLIIAPHPDDETLGCGGTAALLLKAGFKVHFIFLSDGTGSHPNSKKYPAARLRELREEEALKAVNLLGGEKQNVEFLALPDRDVPNENSLYFESIVRLMVSRISLLKPQTIFIPWQNDPHPDHQAAYQIVSCAVSRLNVRPRLLQYPIWLWEMGSSEDISKILKMNICCVDITGMRSIKQKALQAHQSQTTDLIDDDPEGFRLSEQVISHFNGDRELFFQS